MKQDSKVDLNTTMIPPFAKKGCSPNGNLFTILCITFDKGALGSGQK
jgi:hypothetical protein